MHGVFLDLDTLRPAELDLAGLQSTLPCWTFHERTADSQTAARIADATVVVTNKVVIDGALMRSCPRLQLICVCATGMNNVDLDAAAALGIRVRNVTGYAGASVAQHVLALMLALATQWPRYARAVAAGEWSRSPMFCLMDFPVVELAGKTLGIVGAGELGTRVGRLGEAFDMNVILARLPAREYSALQSSPWPRLPWKEFLGGADFISIHCPLAPPTRDLFDADAFRSMKHSAFLINTARGGIVDEAALLAALREDRIAGAALDVLAAEPPPVGHPLTNAGLDNLIVTPHNAWISRDCRQRLLAGVTRNIQEFLAENPQVAPRT